MTIVRRAEERRLRLQQRGMKKGPGNRRVSINSVSCVLKSKRRRVETRPAPIRPQESDRSCTVGFNSPYARYLLLNPLRQRRITTKMLAKNLVESAGKSL
jgi:hypothetical protein